MANYFIRPLVKDDAKFLWDMVYEAIFIPAGMPPLPRHIVTQPHIAAYVQGWGQPGDMGYIVIDPKSDQPVGAAWVRLFTREHAGYGYVADHFPELTIALQPGYRGLGLGSLLLTYLCREASFYFPGISLSVSCDNPARRLYHRFGFEVVGESEFALTMLKRLEPLGSY